MDPVTQMSASVSTSLPSAVAVAQETVIELQLVVLRARPQDMQ